MRRWSGDETKSFEASALSDFIGPISGEPEARRDTAGIAAKSAGRIGESGACAKEKRPNATRSVVWIHLN